MSDPIVVDRDGAVLRIALSRPEKKNALTGAMYDALTQAFTTAGADESCGAIFIEGSGGVFCAGNDIGDFLSHAGDFRQAPAFRFIRTLAANEVPVVAAVDGVAIGIGATMLLHCDLSYATPGAQFRLPFVDLGVVPEAAASLLLPQRIGLTRASELLLLGEPFDAATARRYRLINEVVEAGRLGEVARRKAQALAAKPRNALRATRRLLRGDPAAVLARIDEEAAIFAQALHTPEARAAMAAFMARGKA